jgi:hypothetical protein
VEVELRSDLAGAVQEFSPRVKCAFARVRAVPPPTYQSGKGDISKVSEGFFGKLKV